MNDHDVTVTVYFPDSWWLNERCRWFLARFELSVTGFFWDGGNLILT